MDISLPTLTYDRSYEMNLKDMTFSDEKPLKLGVDIDTKCFVNFYLLQNTSHIIKRITLFELMAHPAMRLADTL